VWAAHETPGTAQKNVGAPRGAPARSRESRLGLSPLGDPLPEVRGDPDLLLATDIRLQRVKVAAQGLLGRARLPEDCEAVATCCDEAVGRHCAGGVAVKRCAVDRHARDALSGWVRGVVGVVEPADLEYPVHLELLFEEPVDLVPRKLHLDDLVVEWLHREELTVGYLARLDVGADASRVHERYLGASVGPLGVGYEVTQRALPAGVAVRVMSSEAVPITLFSIAVTCLSCLATRAGREKGPRLL
jgi:hypothetical protein